MKLKSIRIKNVKRLHSSSISFYDEMREKIKNRNVVVGKNGSGKTTLLEVIYALSYVMEKLGKGVQGDIALHLLSPGAIEAFFEYPDDGGKKELLVRAGDAYRAFYNGNPPPVKDDIYIGKVDNSKEDTIAADKRTGTSFLRKVLIAAAGFEDRTPVGNVLYFPTDRFAHFHTGQGELVNEKPEFRWCYRFDRNHREWKGSLESFLVWLYFQDLQREKLGYQEPSKFDEFKEMINRFLEGKKITSVNNNLKVDVVEEVTNKTLGLEALSSGEKQVILLLGEIYRHISQGSLILIDEPEIHLHPVWQRIFVATLTDMCEKYDAQFILTTQSPEIAKSVMSHEVISLDNLMDESQEAADE